MLEAFRPTESDHGAIDPKTYAAIEADKLFVKIDHTRTETGRLHLYRSLTRPLADAQLLQHKQDALREIESDAQLRESFENYIARRARYEHTLKYLLYGEFSGGLTTDVPVERTGRLELGGYGYLQ